jgi:hypothetical protein
MISTDSDQALLPISSSEPKKPAPCWKSMVQPEYTSWITKMEVNIDTTILALPKGSSTLRLRAELEETLNANYPDYTQI